jgi:Fe-S-cluster containining protein
MRALPVISTKASTVSSRLVNCKGCTVCCESGGLVYIKDDEVSPLRSLKVPLVVIGGVTFIKRLPDGSCPMLNQAEKNCSIYENRPLCCRLFPLDVLQGPSGVTWAISNECPDERKLFAVTQGTNSPFGFGTVSLMTSMLNTSLSAEDSDYFARKEQVSARLDLSNIGQISWTRLTDCAPSDEKIPRLMSKKETAKEKYKRKLKEREDNKKKKKTKREKKKR